MAIDSTMNAVNEIDIDLDNLENSLGEVVYDWNNIPTNDRLFDVMENDLNEMKNRVEKTLLDLKKFKNLWEKNNG